MEQCDACRMLLALSCSNVTQPGNEAEDVVFNSCIVVLGHVPPTFSLCRERYVTDMHRLQPEVLRHNRR